MGKKWTSQEIAFMKNNWGYRTVPEIAKALSRTVTAVILKSKRLHLGSPKIAGEEMTANSIALLMGIDSHVVTRWVKKYGLKSKKKPICGSQIMIMIKVSNLMNWLRKHQDKWDSRRVELFAFGMEPEWLKSKRKADMSKSVKAGTKWTVIEDQQAMALYRKGVKLQIIANEIGRSRASVEHRIARIDVWGDGRYIGNKRSRAVREAVR